MGSTVVSRKRLDLQDNPELLSPPRLNEPLYQCASAITVYGYVLNATIDIQLNGAIVASVPGGAPWPNGINVPLPTPLTAGDKVRARQRTATASSPWSGVGTARDHVQDYPAGPPRPEIHPAPV